MLISENIKKTLFKRIDLPFISKAEQIVQTFSPAEKALFWILSASFFASAIFLVSKVNDYFSVIAPARGGTLAEGVIGSPRFLNPILSLSDADRDLASLIYSGLLKAMPDGTLAPDLAESYQISNDGKTYTFTLKDKIYFHDGTPITADDVLFTVQKAEDPAIKSPRRANWEGVLAEKVDDKTVRFTLKQPYSPFLENAALGILPKNLWKSIDADQFPFSPLNTNPIGSGPYKIAKVIRDATGAATYYQLRAFKKYAEGEPFITNLNFRFYASEEALISAYGRGEIESISAISSADAVSVKQKGGQIERTPLPRIFGAFFNQNQQPIFTDKNVRVALDLATDKQAIVDSVLNGYGAAIGSPIPLGIAPEPADTTGADDNSASVQAALNPGANSGVATSGENVSQAIKLLGKSGWKLNVQTQVMEKTDKKTKKTSQLAFSISTSNAPELKKTAEMLASMWAKIGAKAEVKIFEAGDLNQNVIRPRKYDALLFGEIVGRDLDLFAFWHSSQRNDPGLNIALYTNVKADKLLEDARALSDRSARMEKYAAFEKEVANDTPAVFIYSPDFLYVVPAKIKGIKIGYITMPSERFLNIGEWYIDTEEVWSIFAGQKN